MPFLVCFMTWTNFIGNGKVAATAIDEVTTHAPTVFAVFFFEKKCHLLLSHLVEVQEDRRG